MDRRAGAVGTDGAARVRIGDWMEYKVIPIEFDAIIFRKVKATWRIVLSWMCPVAAMMCMRLGGISRWQCDC